MANKKPVETVNIRIAKKDRNKIKKAGKKAGLTMVEQVSVMCKGL